MITKERKRVQTKLRRKYNYQTLSYANGISIIKPNAARYTHRKKDKYVVDMCVSVSRYAVYRNAHDKTEYPEIEIHLRKLVQDNEDENKWTEAAQLSGYITLEELELIYKAVKEAELEIVEVLKR